MSDGQAAAPPGPARGPGRAVEGFPFKPVEVAWKRPAIPRGVLQDCTKRSDFQGLVHSLGVLAILCMSGGLAYYLFSVGEWPWMALALYLHGALFAFNPQNHEFSHGTVFRTKALNRVFGRLFGFLHWTDNAALYKLSHGYHHQYTLHRQSEGEEVHPRPEFAEEILHAALRVVDLAGFLDSLYDRVHSLLVPFLLNPRRDLWLRYVYAQAGEGARRDVFWTTLSQLAFHALFAAAAIVTGHWFLIVVVSLPSFYGGRWYHLLVHDTMHVGREPETDDFRLCCRTVRVDPLSSFMYWHMEWHTEHHAYAGVPCYNLRRFHRLTKEHWERPQGLAEAWREMDGRSRRLMGFEA